MITESGLIRMLPVLADWSSERRQDVMRGLGKLAEGVPVWSPDSGDKIAVIWLPPDKREAVVYIASCEDAIETARMEGEDLSDPKTSDSLIRGIKRPVPPGFARVLIACDNIRALLHVPCVIALQSRGGEA